MLNCTVNSSLCLICAKYLGYDGDELTIVDCKQSKLENKVVYPLFFPLPLAPLSAP